MLLQVSLSSAGTFSSYIISTSDPSGTNPVENINPPISGQSYFLWQHFSSTTHGTINDTAINVLGNEIDLFLLRGDPLPLDPPPPLGSYYSIAEFEGLTPGTYNLNYFRVPTGNAFPPSDATAPMFFVETIQFNVFGARVIDSSSKQSLLLLMLLMLLSYWRYNKKPKIRFR